MKKSTIADPQELPSNYDSTSPNRHDVNDIVTIQVPIRIKRYGHIPVFENGAMVVVNSHVVLYGQLEEPFVGPSYKGYNQEKHNLFGIVVDRVWHYCEADVIRQIPTHLSPGGYGDVDEQNVRRELPPTLRSNHGGCVFLWYHVMFHEGLFWVRYDWIDVTASVSAAASKK